MEQGVRAQLACQQGRVAGDVGQECVEVARNIPGTVAFRDSKDVTGPIVVVAPSAWAAFAGYFAGYVGQRAGRAPH
ncbi:DUF397 domain-containing protein [Streptomyces sp. NPDC059441]|uniref:DUF397 domain-containing protein n=1 Tax=Streptomyces sp. NPDC059441 TaxID=3346829 RepID=UPI0036C92728